jgi:lipopolysaccharide cholinephosphotransferase
LTDLTLAELRGVQLAILREVDQLCRSHGLTYYLAFGTLLGAVRHGGYIPWDDDIDVMMPRSDYTRLVQVFAAVAPVHLRLGSTQTQADWPLPYAKVSDSRTELWEPFEEPVPLGVNIDVFPVDDLPPARWGVRVQSLVLRVLRWAVELRYIAAERGRAWHHPLALAIGKPVLRRVPMHRLVRALEWTASSTGSGAGGRRDDRVGVRVGSFDWSVPRSSLDPAGELVFEGLRFPAPRDPDQVLRAVYGDYRTLPPEHQRVSEHAFRAAWRQPSPAEGSDGGR